MEILSDKEKEDLLIKIKNERIVMKREKKEQFDDYPSREDEFYLNLNERIKEDMYRNNSSFDKKQKKTNYASKTLEEYQEKQKFSHKPQINQLDPSIYKHVYQKDTNKVEVSKEQLWRRLLETKEQVRLEREHQYNQQLESKLQECTFVPEINQMSKQIVELDSERQQCYEDRLYDDNRQRIFNKDKIRQQYLQQMNEQMKQPVQSMQLKGEKNDQKPIYERVDQIVKEKKKKINQMIIKQEQQQDELCRFQPTIDQKSRNIFLEKDQNGDVVERLIQYEGQQKIRKQKLIQEHEYEQSQKYTFQPKVNSGYNVNLSEPFVLRQQLIHNHQEENQHKKQDEYYKQQTQQVQINQVSEIIVSCDPDRRLESGQDKINRLYKKDQQKKQLVQQQVQQAYYDQYSFKPQINEVSKAIGQSKNNQQQQEKVKQKHLQKKQELEEQKLKECQFQPNLYKKNKYKYVESKYKKDQISQNIQDQQKQKQRKMEKIKQEKEYNELKDCTFKPKIKQYEESGETEVKGFDKVIENREKIMLKEQQKKQRQEELFAFEKKYNYEKHNTHTKAVPFNLSYQKKANNRSSKRQISSSQNMKQSDAYYREEYQPQSIPVQQQIEEPDAKKREILRRVIENIQ